MNRRHFLALIGATAPAALILPELLVPHRTFFLPPSGGWAPSLGDLWLDYVNLARPAGVEVTIRVDFIARKPAIVELNSIGRLELVLPEETDAELRDRMLARFKAPENVDWSRGAYRGTLSTLMPWELDA
jgi:hypothetical protein